MNIVLDTNILVSAVWSPGRNASDILNATFAGRFTVCYDHRILEEYVKVLHYPKLDFREWEISAILDPLVKHGLSVVADPITDIDFERDETDRKFYEVAKFCDAILISGNRKHYPVDEFIVDMGTFKDRYM